MSKQIAPESTVSTPVESVANTTGSITKDEKRLDKSSTETTYTFNQTISTRNDPAYVGADGDLYIGNAKVVIYGKVNELMIYHPSQNVSSKQRIIYKQLIKMASIETYIF